MDPFVWEYLGYLCDIADMFTQNQALKIPGLGSKDCSIQEFLGDESAGAISFCLLLLRNERGNNDSFYTRKNSDEPSGMKTLQCELGFFSIMTPTTVKFLVGSTVIYS